MFCSLHAYFCQKMTVFCRLAFALVSTSTLLLPSDFLPPLPRVRKLRSLLTAAHIAAV